MFRQIRKTLTGTECWDPKAKKVVIIRSDQDKRKQHSIDFNQMTVKELKQYAAENKIEIPADIIKKDDIIQFLTDDAQ